MSSCGTAALLCSCPPIACGNAINESNGPWRLSSNDFLCQFVTVRIAPPWPENDVWRLFRPSKRCRNWDTAAAKTSPRGSRPVHLSNFPMWFSSFFFFLLFAFLFKHVSRTSSYCVTPLRWKNTSICVRRLGLGLTQERHRKAELEPSCGAQIELLPHNVSNIVNQAKRLTLPRPSPFPARCCVVFLPHLSRSQPV